MMDEFNSETDSDYTSYWRDWVSPSFSFPLLCVRCPVCVVVSSALRSSESNAQALVDAQLA